MTGWSSQRPGQDMYKQAHSNIGNYYSGSQGKPYINPNVQMYVPNDGECAIRIVDPIELLELGVYFFDVHFHRNVGFRNDYFLCLLRHNLGPCAICELATEDLWQTDKDAAKGFLPDQRRLMWVLDLKKPQEANILKLWSCPRTLSDEILAQSRDPEMDIIKEISHPFEGVPVYYTRTGKGRNTKYTGVKLGTRPMPLDESIAEQRFRFMDILIIPTYEEVQASQHMQDLPPEADREGPPISAYDEDDGYTPSHEMGARDAANAERTQAQGSTQAGARSQDAGGVWTDGQEVDYGDLERINPGNRDCFRQFFDNYEECDACPDRVLCQQPWPVKRVAKTSKTARPDANVKRPKPTHSGADSGISRPDPISRPTHTSQAQRPNPSHQNTGAMASSGQGPDNAAKIQSAQEKLRADIARRKAQG